MTNDLITGGLRLLDTVETIRRIHFRHYKHKGNAETQLFERIPADLPALLELRDLVPACVAYAERHKEECPPVEILSEAIAAWWTSVEMGLNWNETAGLNASLHTTDFPPVLATVDTVRAWIDKQAEERLSEGKVARSTSEVAGRDLGESGSEGVEPEADGLPPGVTPVQLDAVRRAIVELPNGQKAGRDCIGEYVRETLNIAIRNEALGDALDHLRARGEYKPAKRARSSR